MPPPAGTVSLVLTTYRRALALPGAWQFSLTGFGARLPIAMVGLGIVLYISTTTGSYAIAGILSAAFQVSAAVGAIVTSRWMDRVGQDRLLPWLAALNALALTAFVVAVESGAPVIVQALVIAVAGAAQPAIGSMVRARWAAAAPDADRLRGAFALESIIDELIFSIGPLITAFLAFQVSLPAPLIAGAVIGLVGGILLALQRRTQPTPTPRAPKAERIAGGSALQQPGLLLLVVAAMGIGGVFGSYEVSVVAFSRESGSPGASGLILGLWAFGSMLGGIVFGAWHWRLPLARQIVILSAILTVVLIPAPFITSLPVLAVATFLSGAAVAPALIAGFSLTERLVPSRLLTEGLTWTNSGLALGFSAGTFLAGVLVDARGTSVAFILPILSAAVSVLVAGAGQSVLMRAAHGHPQPGPTITWNADPVPGPAPGGIVDDPD